MRIDGFKDVLPGLDSLQPIQKPQPRVEPGTAQQGGSFNEIFVDALKEVDQMQRTAEDHVEGISVGKDGYTTHGAMIALEKADIAFQLMSQIKSKIVMAYQEVMRTQV